MLYDKRLFLTEFEDPKTVQRVLDVGTGTGIWAIDYGILQISDH